MANHPKKDTFTNYYLIMSYSEVLGEKNQVEITNEDLFLVLKEIEKITTAKQNTKIILILNSIGGDIYTAYKIINVLREKCKEFDVIILENANSAATLMALGSDKIIMGKQSELGPLDLPMQEHPLFEGVIGPLSALDGIRPLSYLYNAVYV